MTNAPPLRHEALALQLAAQNPQGGALRLPVCADCGCVVYPLRETCTTCLSDRLEWREVDNTAELLAVTTLHHSNEPYFKDQLPLRMGSVKLATGAVAIVFVEDGPVPGDRVRITCKPDTANNGVLVARS